MTHIFYIFSLFLKAWEDNNNNNINNQMAETMSITDDSLALGATKSPVEDTHQHQISSTFVVHGHEDEFDHSTNKSPRADTRDKEEEESMAYGTKHENVHTMFTYDTTTLDGKFTKELSQVIENYEHQLVEAEKRNEETNKKLEDFKKKYDTLNHKHQENSQKLKEQEINGIKTILTNDIKEDILKYFEVADVEQEEKEKWTDLSIAELLRKCEELKLEEKQVEEKEMGKNHRPSVDNSKPNKLGSQTNSLQHVGEVFIALFLGVAIGIYGNKKKWWDGWF
ncbi:hypothetical protein RFI_13367 [Reticulomyxa filosa]|uniref:Uncharacterized protein n=1 Tax=Reticulomyxa filosa TaxID=46433 RepID=X6ND36_RETFI|nr:hypothetical protein RFI_13367 [Reticulomyxa filosa]|eukprot:ETO23808.1 hypothetical protein RFI_13367 [Reticulomyxa filosa]